MDSRDDSFAEDKAKLRELISLVTFPAHPDDVGDLSLAIKAYTDDLVSLGADEGLARLIETTSPYVSLAQLAYSDRFGLHKYLGSLENAERAHGRDYVLNGIRQSPYLVPFLVDEDLYGKIEKHFSWYQSFKNRSTPLISDAVVGFSSDAVSSSFDLRTQRGDCEQLVLELATLRKPLLDISRANIFDVYVRGSPTRPRFPIRTMSFAATFSAVAVHNDAVDQDDELRRVMAVWHIEHLAELGNLGGSMDRLIGSPQWYEMAASSKSANATHSRLSRNWVRGSNYREQFLNDGCWKSEGRVPEDVWSLRYVDLMCHMAKQIDETSLFELRRSILPES